jgi:hypothetical protein
LIFRTLDFLTSIYLARRFWPIDRTNDRESNATAIFPG